MNYDLLFKEVGLGGNMVALEVTTIGYQILVSDGQGNLPRENDNWKVSVFGYNYEDNEFDDEPIWSFKFTHFSKDNMESFVKIVLLLLKTLR